MNLPAANFCIWPRALPRCRGSRASRRRKPIRHGPSRSDSIGHRWPVPQGRARACVPRRRTWCGYGTILDPASR